MIKIICVGKIKEKYLKDAIKEYQKRLSKYTKLEIIELPDYNYDTVKTKIEEEMQYPGTVKVTVIRETRVTEEAK